MENLSLRWRSIKPVCEKDKEKERRESLLERSWERDVMYTRVTNENFDKVCIQSDKFTMKQ